MGTAISTSLVTRTLLGFQAPVPALQERLPDPWQLAPIARGSFEGANLLVVFNEALLKLDSDGNPAPDAVNRYVGFVLPATHSDSGEPANFPFRIYAAHPQSIPGRYKTARQVNAQRELVAEGADAETTVTDRFEFTAGDGGQVVLALQYERGVPKRVISQVNVRSVVDPDIHRIHRLDQLVDVVRSVPGGVDRVESYQLRVTVAELADVLDGTEQLVSIAVNPWHIREVVEP